MRHLVLVRHGESVFNAEGRVQGQRCAGLSGLGHDQAQHVAVALGREAPGARIVTSDLRRARETAEPLVRALGRPADEDPRLRERTFGRWEGLLREEVAQQDPDRWRRWLAGEDVIGEVGGETRGQLAERAVDALRQLLSGAAEGSITVVVAHGGTIWYGLHRLLGLPAASLGGVDNASISRLAAWEPDGDSELGGRTVLERYNELAHLPERLRVRWQPRRHVVAAARPAG